MAVSVTVVQFASSSSITGASFSGPRRRGASSTELQSRLSIRSASSYQLSVRSEGDSAGTTSESILVRMADGRFRRVTDGASPVVAQAQGSGDLQSLDLIVRVDSARSSSRGLVAELVSARLDQ